jgi:hypothetical protein
VPNDSDTITEAGTCVIVLGDILLAVAEAGYRGIVVPCLKQAGKSIDDLSKILSQSNNR